MKAKVKRAIDWFVIAILPLLMAACAHDRAAPEPVITTISVAKPVTISCVPPSVGEPPTYPDTQAALQAAAGAPDRFLQLLLAGRDQRDARLTEIEPVVKGCRK